MRRFTDYYDVVILPPAALTRYAVGVSRRIARRFGSPLILDERRAVPHISLYHVAVARRRREEFQQVLTGIARRTKADVLEVIGTHVYRDFGSIAIELSKPEWLRRLYLNILHRTSALRDAGFDNHRAWGAERLSPQQRRLISRYGTPLVGRHFIPHITVTVLKDAAQLGEAALIKPPGVRFRVGSLHLCLQGPHHTCRQILLELPLKN